MAFSLRHKVSLAALLCATSIVPACSSDEPGSPGPSGDNPSGGSATSLDDFLKENGILKLEGDGTGIERGVGTSDASGKIAFYSPAKNGIVQFQLGAPKAPALAGLTVHVSASAESATYYVDDPSGKYAPLLFSRAFPEGDTSEVIDAAGIFEEGGVYEFDDKAPSPFPMRAFTLGEINFTQAFQAAMQETAIQMALFVFKTIVTSTCTFFAPLHQDVCDKVGDYIGWAASVYRTGVKVVVDPKGFNIGDLLLKIGVDVALPEVLNKLVCEPIGKQIFVAYRHPNAEAPADAAFRKAAFKLNYMLHKVGSTPPANKDAVLEELGRVGAALSGIGGLVRSNYLQVYNPESFKNFKESAAFTGISELVKSTVSEIEIDKVQGLSPVLRKLLLPIKQGPGFEIKDYTFKVSSPFNTALGCVMTVLDKVIVGEIDGMAGANDLEMSMEEGIGGMVDVLDEKLNAIHEKGWGKEPLPDPTCLPDLFEPNDTWQYAVQSPIGGEISGGSGPVTIDKLNLCDASGKGGAGDADWYAFPVGGPFQFQVQARIMKVDDGKNDDKKLCTEIYWYSENYEISEIDPDKITGPACGAVKDEFATSQVNVGKTLGESWATVLVKVYPDPSGGGALPEVDYKLLVKP
jgi:hypothetical protein